MSEETPGYRAFLIWWDWFMPDSEPSSPRDYYWRGLTDAERAAWDEISVAGLAR